MSSLNPGTIPFSPSVAPNASTTEYMYSYIYDYSNLSDSTESPEMEYGLQVAYSVGDFLTHYYTPALVLIGSIGNILSVIVFFKTKLRKLSSSYYLAALGISDTCFLIGAFVSWLNYLNINIYNRNYFCQFFTYMSGLCSFLSVWFVVAFTVERFIVVLYPLKRQTMCTVKRACSVLVGLILTGCTISIPYFIYAAPQYSDVMGCIICDVREQYKFHMQIYNYIDTVIVFVIPFSTIVILNTFTALTVWKVAGVRRSMTMQKRKPSSKSLRKTTPSSRVNYPMVANGHIHQCKKIPKKTTNACQIKVTKMLLIVSSVFVCLNLPSYIMRIKAFLIPNDQMPTRTTVITQYICWFFFITNFGINFALYCLSGQNFRKAVISMFTMFTKKQLRNNDVGITQVTVSEYLQRTSSTISSKRRIITHNGVSSYDMHELQNGSAGNHIKPKMGEKMFS